MRALKKALIRRSVLLAVLAVCYAALCINSSRHRETPAGDEASDQRIRILSLAAGEVQGIHIENGKGTLDLIRESDTWKLADEPELQVKSDAVNRMLNSLRNLNGEDAIEVSDSSGLAEYGLTDPEITAVLALSSGESAVIRVGDVNRSVGRVYFSVTVVKGIFNSAQSLETEQSLTVYTHGTSLVTELDKSREDILIDG